MFYCATLNYLLLLLLLTVVWSVCIVADISQNTGISLEHVTLTLNLLRLASNKDTGLVY